MAHFFWTSFYLFTQLYGLNLPLWTIERLFASTYTLEASSVNVQLTFRLNLHTGSFQWECPIAFLFQLTHWGRPLGKIK